MIVKSKAEGRKMTSLRNAIKLARSKAAKSTTYHGGYYVVYSPEEEDIHGNDFHVCTEMDLDTWFSGCSILYFAE